MDEIETNLRALEREYLEGRRPIPTLDATRENELTKAASIIGEAMMADSEYGRRKARIMLEASNLHASTEDETVREMLRQVFERWGK